MAQQQARDEAGNIWYVDDAGNPVGLAQAAPQGGGSVVAPNPVQAQRQSADLGGAQLGNQKTAQQIALDAVKLQTAPQMSAEELRAQQLANQKAERDLAAPVEAKQTITDRLSRLRQLAGQVGRTQSLYDSGIGQTKGIKGVLDYLPTDANARFDVAGGQLSQQGLAAFRQPGSGTVSDRDAAMFDRANLPTSGTRDAAVEEQLRSIRSRVDEEMKALGQQPVNWAAITQQQSDQSQQDRNAPMIASGGGGSGNPPPPTGPAGYDVAGVAGGVSGGPGGAGSTFADAAGVAMATKLKQAYNQGAGVQQLNQLLTENGYQPFADPQAIEAINKRGPLNFAPPQAADNRSGLSQMLGGAADSSGGAYAISAADALSAGTLDNIAGGNAKLAEEYAAQKFPGATLAGQVTGGALAAGAGELGLARLGVGAGRAALGGDALYGAAYGAGSTDDGSRLLGAVGGGVGGLAGGIAGRAAARGIGGALTGVQNPNIQALRRAGVDDMSVGQALSQSGPVGAGIKRAEDLLTGIPGVGTMVNNRRLGSLQGFNRAAFNDGLAPIGATTNGLTQEAGVEAAQAATNQGYRQALDPVNVTRDPQFTGDYNNAINTGTGVARVGPEFQSWAQANLDPLVAQPSFDGRTVQDFIQQTRKADFGNDAMGDLVGRSVTGAEDAMRGLVQRQAPDALPALSKADQAYRKTQVLKDAVNRARNGTQSGETGIFTPAQLSDAAAANAKRYGGTQGTTRQPFFDLTRAAQDVLPSKAGDSGSAGRLLMQGALGAAGVGGAGGLGYATGDGEGAGYGAGGALAVAALLAAGGSKGAQRLAVKALADRPDALVQLGNQVQRRARIGGLFGAPMLAGGGAYLAGQ